MGKDKFLDILGFYDTTDEGASKLSQLITSRALTRIRELCPTIVFATQEDKHKVILASNTAIKKILDEFMDDTVESKKEIDRILDKNFSKAVENLAQISVNCYNKLIKEREEFKDA